MKIYNSDKTDRAIVDALDIDDLLGYFGDDITLDKDGDYIAADLNEVSHIYATCY